MKVRYVYWQEDDQWLGYLEEFPDYWTQGESLEDLKEHLRDLHDDLSNDRIPEVRRTAELEIPVLALAVLLRKSATVPTGP
jgi:hypothetical protein